VKRFMIVLLVMVLFVALAAGPAAADWHEFGGSFSCWQLVTSYVRSAGPQHWHYQEPNIHYAPNPTPYLYSTTMWQSGRSSVWSTALGDNILNDSGFDYAGSYVTCWH